MSGSPFGILEARSSEHAADISSDASKYAADLQLQMYREGTNALAPYVSSGNNALAQLNKLQGGDFSGFTQSPDYQFALQQGQQGIQRAASATGRLGSGDYLKDATKYAQGLASQTYNDFYNRWQNMAQLGQSAAARQATNALSAGNSAGGFYNQAGQAQAAGILGQGQAYGNAMSNAGNQVGNYLMQNRGGYGYNYNQVPAAGYGGWGGADYMAGNAATGLGASDMAYLAFL